MNNKNMQFLNILGEIDDKFYDEALGGDTEKPLRIDLSRKPLKWYRVAAPIAACLVLGVGVFALKHYLDRPGVIPPDFGALNSLASNTYSDPGNSDISSDTSNTSGSDSLPEGIDYYEEYPMISADNIPTITNSHGAYDEEDIANRTLSITKYGGYDVCLAAEKVFYLEDDGYDNMVYAAKMKLCLVKDGRLISSDYVGQGWLSTATSGWCIFAFYGNAYNINVDAYEFSDGIGVVSVRYNRADLDGGEAECSLYGIKNEEISVLYGTDVTGTQPSPSVKFSYSAFKQIGTALIDPANGREYRLNPDAWGNDPYKEPHYTTHFYGVSGLSVAHSAYYMESSKLPATTEADLQNWKDFIRNINISHIEVDKGFASADSTDMPMLSEQACAVMDMLASAELRTTKETEPWSGGGITVNAFDNYGNHVLSFTYTGNVSLIYENNSPLYFFDTDDLQELYKLIPASTQTNDIIAAKQLGDDYTIQIAPNNGFIEMDGKLNVFETFICVDHKGKKTFIAIDIQPDNELADKALFDDVITTFEMKDGIGFIVRPIYNEGYVHYNHAYFFKLDGDEVTGLKYEYDYAPAGPGTLMYVGSDFKISAEENAVIADNGDKYIIDFDENLIRSVS